MCVPCNQKKDYRDRVRVQVFIACECLSGIGSRMGVTIFRREQHRASCASDLQTGIDLLVLCVCVYVCGCVGVYGVYVSGCVRSRLFGIRAHTANLAHLTLLVQFGFGFLLDRPDVVHRQTMPAVHPAEHLTAIG